MKKARIMLASFAVLAVVGSALAFKAESAYGKIIWKAPSAGAQANVQVSNYTLDVITGVPTITGFYTTVQNNPGVAATAYQQN